jgi:hypothetical protein
VPPPKDDSIASIYPVAGRNRPKSLGQARDVAPQAAERFVFGPFRPPRSGQFHGWSIAQITLQTVSYPKAVGQGSELDPNRPNLSCEATSVPNYPSGGSLAVPSPANGRGRVGVLPLPFEQPTDHHQDEEREPLLRRGDLHQPELASVAHRQERRVEQIRPRAPAALLRLEDRRWRILYVVGRLNIPRAPKVLLAGVPELVGLPRSEHHRLLRSRKPSRLSGARHYEHALPDMQELAANAADGYSF